MMQTEHDSSGGTGASKALRNAVIVVFLLLVVIPPLRSLAVPMAIVAFAAGVVYVARRIVRYNRSLGLSAIATAMIATSLYLFLLYSAEQRHKLLLSQLAGYSDVTVRRNVFPLPYVRQLSIGLGVNDAEFAAILKLDGLDHLSELYLEDDTLTDACLGEVAAIPHLAYVFIDCDNITDDAILDLEARLPDCRVIPYQRNLHGENRVFLGMPPDGR